MSLLTKPALDLSKLSLEEKFELIDEIWQSLSPEDLALTADTRAEIDRRLDRLDREGSIVRDRLAAHEANPGAARTWSEVRREIEERSGGRRSR